MQDLMDTAVPVPVYRVLVCILKYDKYFVLICKSNENCLHIKAASKTASKSECIRSGILHSKILVSNIPCVQKCTYTAQHNYRMVVKSLTKKGRTEGLVSVEKL